MIKIDDVEVFGFRKAIHGIRNSFDSWDKSDSRYKGDAYIIGKEDMKLATSLIKAGASHRKFTRMIHVQFDMLAPLFFWKQFDTYKIGTTANSTSTMHTLMKKHLTIDDFSVDAGCQSIEKAMKSIEAVIASMNELIDRHHATSDEDERDAIERAEFQLLPESFNQLRTIDLNYETLLTIYFQRRYHKLDCWQEFCEWIESLPYMSEFITAYKKGLN